RAGRLRAARHFARNADGVVAFALMRIPLAGVGGLVLAACGGGNREAAAPANAATAAAKADDTDEPAIQSNDILAREAVTKKARVKHVLIGWKDLRKSDGPEGTDPPARSPAPAEAGHLAVK